MDAQSDDAKDYIISLNESFPAFIIEDVHNVTIKGQGWQLGYLSNNLEMWDPYYI